jgi:hypothetical protein
MPLPEVDGGRALAPLIEDMRHFGREHLGVPTDSAVAREPATAAA